ncbi:hypothetical protein TPPCIT_120 [Candidatus Tremblaya princeps PCIT]|uniref:Uncharacterized protein n=1 Tax=Tremblaya princeps (strain PCIT) TaxID=891398 RepID=F7XYJ9_TREPP|nr:hypothetical protein TPPCIT_120 [Candidatus Tremblaya princeps PCIT]
MSGKAMRLSRRADWAPQLERIVRLAHSPHGSGAMCSTSLNTDRLRTPMLMLPPASMELAGTPRKSLTLGRYKCMSLSVSSCILRLLNVTFSPTVSPRLTLKLDMDLDERVGMGRWPAIEASASDMPRTLGARPLSRPIPILRVAFHSLGTSIADGPRRRGATLAA